MGQSVPRGKVHPIYLGNCWAYFTSETMQHDPGNMIQTIFYIQFSQNVNLHYPLLLCSCMYNIIM